MAPAIHAPIIPRGILHTTVTKLNPININAHEGVSTGHLSAIIASAIDVMKKTEAAVIFIFKNEDEYFLKRTFPSTSPLKKAEKTTNGSASAETINVEITESLAGSLRARDAAERAKRKKANAWGKWTSTGCMCKARMDLLFEETGSVKGSNIFAGTPHAGQLSCSLPASMT